MADGFDSRGMGLRAQKKLLSKMASRKIAKNFIDDTSGKLLDNLYKLSKAFSDKKTAEKLTKNLIKIVIKIGILYRNDQFSKEELQLAEKFKQKFHTISMTVVSFYEVDFTFDKHFLSAQVVELQMMLKDLVRRHLTDKSQDRIDNVFTFYSNPELFEKVFNPESVNRELLGKIITDLNRLMEEGIL